MWETISDSESIVTFIEDELTLLIKFLIHTPIRNKKKCGQLELYNVEKKSVEFKIYEEVFTETFFD